MAIDEEKIDRVCEEVLHHLSTHSGFQHVHAILDSLNRLELLRICDRFGASKGNEYGGSRNNGELRASIIDKGMASIQQDRQNQVPRKDASLEWTLFKPKLSKRECNHIIEKFLDTGSTTHSSNASSLGAVIQYCEDNKIPYILRAEPGVGYYIQKV